MAKLNFFEQMATKCWYICTRMSRLIEDIGAFLTSNGFKHSYQMRYGMDVICVALNNGKSKIILSLEFSAKTPQEAKDMAEYTEESIRFISSHDGEYPLIITQDRWEMQHEMTKKRLLAHLEIFSPIYARNCEIRKIDKAIAKEFLTKSHSYGHAVCRYCYGIYFKRHTGYIKEFHDATQAASNGTDKPSSSIEPGTLIAVATFSNARKWIKGEQTIRSYEWTRYASLPEVRISGGMGKVLKEFIKDVQPDDIMTYADLEWSAGDVYKTLGFKFEGVKEPVLFEISSDMQRFPIKSRMTRGREDSVIDDSTGNLYFQNFGSNKYRLKLTEYK